MLKLKRISKFLLGTLAAGIVLLAQGQTLSQNPLLTKTVPVKPNLLVNLDDSGSMFYGFLYEYGGSQDFRGNTGPLSQTYAAYSPDINRIYYDPRILYKRRVNNDGTLQEVGNVNAYVVKQNCDPQNSGDNCDNSNAPEQSTGGTYTIKVYFAKPFGVAGSGLQANGSFSTSPSDTVGPSTAYYNPTYAPSALELVFGATILPYPNVMTWDRTLTTGIPTNIKFNNGTGKSASIVVYPKFKARTDCVSSATSCSWEEERQNHGNWLRYHSNRMRVVTTGIALAFQPLPVTNAAASPKTESTFRLGWATINGLTESSKLVSGVEEWSPTVRTAFFKWLYDFETNTTPAATPTLQAVDRIGVYFTRKDLAGPWATNPTDSSSASSPTNVAITSTSTADLTALSCRRSFELLLTDGYYNKYGAANGRPEWNAIGSSPIPSGPPGEVDGSVQATPPRPSGSTLSPWTGYNPTASPYKDSTTNTLADVAFKYWVKDLRPDIDNNVPTVTGTQPNESYWQNLTFYAIGFGVKGTLTQDSATYNSIAAGAAWPTPVGDKVTTIDDLWHATINGRGLLLSATNADTLKTAIDRMMAKVTEVKDSQTGVAASTASLITGTRKYSPLYTTGSWVGNIIATNLDPGSAADTCVAWQATGPLITGSNVPPACPAGFTTNGIPAHTARNIYAWNGSEFAEFDTSNAHVMEKTADGGVIDMVTNINNQSINLVNYLRGDQSNEDTPTTTNLFRTRTSILGDFVNSTPTFIHGALDMGYSSLPKDANGQADYAAFVTQKAARTEGVLFAGANDGMLHGFRNSTGAEVFAFVPKDVMPRLHKLAERKYNSNHLFYVDGTTAEADACLGVAEQVNKNCSVSEWRNLLIGSLGAGGKSVFAIDVTTLTPSSTMGLSAANILWEITTGSSGYANLGNILGDIQTGVTKGGQWVAVFGNGYYGADGIAHLYVADLATGALLKDISTAAASSNGLSTPTLVHDANQRIIGAYAGDLKGNMWKFDLSGTSASSWGLGLTSTALFAPATAKPITAPPAVISHPSGGRVVAFGTGKFFDTEDAASVSTQSFYGIWDSVEFGDPLPATPTGVVQTGVTNLVQQTVSGPTTGTYIATSASGTSSIVLTTSTVTFSAYTQSKNTIDWTTKRGWFMNMPFSGSGERLVFPMAKLFSPTSRLVVANTLIPSVSTDTCAMPSGGSGYSYIFDLLTGSRPNTSVFPGCVDCSITITPPVPPVTICNSTYCFALKPTEEICTSNCKSPIPIKKFCGPQTGIPCASSVSVKRSWRQLFMR